MAEITNRDSTFDIIKGIAIIFIVLGHISGIFSKYVGLFHIGIFFICSGYFFKDKCHENIESIKKFIKNKVVHLYFPFVIFNGILTILHNFLIKINIYTTNPDFLNITRGAEFGLTFNYSVLKTIKYLFYNLLFYNREQLCFISWFLRALFWILIINCIFHFIIKKFIKDEKIFKIIRLIIYVILFSLGFLCHKLHFNFYSIGTMLSCSILYFTGITYKEYKDKFFINKYTLILSTILLSLICIQANGTISHYKNEYGNMLLFFIVNLLGFIWCYNIAFYINKISILNKIFVYIGQHTLSILLFHIISFKFITYIQILLYNKPDYYLAAIPTYIYNHGWWILYTLAGVFIPLLLAFIYSKFKQSKFITSSSFLKLP